MEFTASRRAKVLVTTDLMDTKPLSERFNEVCREGMLKHRLGAFPQRVRPALPPSCSARCYSTYRGNGLERIAAGLGYRKRRHISQSVPHRRFIGRNRRIRPDRIGKAIRNVALAMRG